MGSNATARFLGSTDDVTSCDCCGRTDLKSTVALSFDGDVTVYYGVVCAAKALGRDPKYVRQETRKADNERDRMVQAALQAERDAAFAKWAAFLAAHGSGADVFTRIQSLGGYAAAKALYRTHTGQQTIGSEVHP